MAVGVFGDEVEEALLLGFGEVLDGQAHGIELAEFAVGSGEDVGGRFLGKSDGFAEFVEGGGEGAGEVFFGGEGTGAFEFVVCADFGGIGGEEGGGVGDFPASAEGEIDGEVVALETPAPGAGRVGFAEDGGVVFGFVAELGAVFDLGEKTFEGDDGIDFKESLLAHGGFEKVVDEFDLFGF